MYSANSNWVYSQQSNPLIFYLKLLSAFSRLNTNSFAMYRVSPMCCPFSVVNVTLDLLLSVHPFFCLSVMVFQLGVKQF